MANSKIVFKQSVAKDLRRIPTREVRRILKRIDPLASEPRLHSAERLTGDEIYSVRQGNYRILYGVEDDIFTVTVVKVGHRRDVYR